MDLMNKFTIILPVFNDWESLEILLQEIELVVKKSSYSCSIIIINDNSSENNIHNLNKNNFFEIWNSDKSKFVRKNLNSSKRCFAPCNKCDVVGDLVGKNHADAWQKYYLK